MRTGPLPDAREICSKNGTRAPEPSSVSVTAAARALTASKAARRTAGETTTAGVRLRAFFFAGFFSAVDDAAAGAASAGSDAARPSARIAGKNPIIAWLPRPKPARAARDISPDTAGIRLRAP